MPIDIFRPKPNYDATVFSVPGEIVVEFTEMPSESIQQAFLDIRRRAPEFSVEIKDQLPELYRICVSFPPTYYGTRDIPNAIVDYLQECKLIVEKINFHLIQQK